MSRGPVVLLLFVGILSAAAGSLLAIDSQARSRGDDRGAEFQRLVGGLGGGAELDMSRCIHGFDPRLDGECGQDLGPIPAANPFCTCDG